MARLWARGEQLYGDHAWIERPQGLLLAYRVVAASGWGPMARVLAMVAASIVTVAVAAAAWALAGRRAAVVAALLFAVLSPAPHLEGFTANGELLASAATTTAVALGAWWSVKHDRRLLLLAGVAAAAGVLTKQAAIDGLVAVGALVLADSWRRRRNPVRDLAVFAGGAAVPLALAFLHGLAIGLDDWWFAVAGHRTQMDSLVNGLYELHRHEFFQSLGPFRRDLGLLVPLAVIGLVAAARRRRLTLPLVWLIAATFGVALGGLFHPHYWVQVAAPLALLTALGLDLVAARWRAAAWVLGAAALVVPLAYSTPAYTAPTADRVSELTSADPRFVAADEVGDAVRDDHRARGPGGRAVDQSRHPLVRRPGITLPPHVVRAAARPRRRRRSCTNGHHWPGSCPGRHRRGHGPLGLRPRRRGRPDARHALPPRRCRGRQPRLPAASHLARGGLRPLVLCPC